MHFAGRFVLLVAIFCRVGHSDLGLGDSLVAARTADPERAAMRNESTLALRGRLIRFAGSGTIATLMLLLVALWLVFAITIGDRFFSVNTLQSMAFQMPELGILSLAMMLALLSARPQPFHHRHR
ncbi:hypothetical protein ABIF78_003260 [Bradyrhizobium japonicum]